MSELFIIQEKNKLNEILATMRNIIIIVIVSILVLSCQKEYVSSTQSKYFLKQYDINYQEDLGYNLQLCPDGGYIFIGTTQDPQANSNTDILLVKVDKFGNQALWSPLIIGGSSNDFGMSVAVVNDGYIIAGSIDNNMALKKIDLNGIEVWSTSYVNTGMLNEVSSGENKIYAVGYSDEGGIRKPFRAAFDLSGLLIDSSIPFAETGDYFTSMVQNGSISICFGTQYRDGKSNIFLIEHGAEGTFSTQEIVFDEPLNETSSKIIPRKSGGFFVVGTVNPVSTEQSVIFIRQLNADYSQNNSFSQSPLNNLLAGQEGNFRGIDVKEMEDGTVVILGDRYLSNEYDIILFFLAPDGTVKFTKLYGKSGDQTASSLQITPDKGLIIMGNNKVQANTMITLIKTDSKGEIWE
jgi:hypothetical protein